ncbi:uncharacterized protein [Diadema antillarum]
MPAKPALYERRPSFKASHQHLQPLLLAAAPGGTGQISSSLNQQRLLHHCSPQVMAEMRDHHVMDLSPSPAAVTLSANYSAFPDDNGSDLKNYAVLTPSAHPESGGVDCLLHLLVKNAQKQKIEACYEHNLPLDPWKWTSTDVTTWASWLMSEINPDDQHEVINMFRTYPITGETLSNLSEQELRPYFGRSCLRAFECLQHWLEGMSPRGFDLQQNLMKVKREEQHFLMQLANDCLNDQGNSNTLELPSHLPAMLTPPHSISADDPLPSIDTVFKSQSDPCAFPFPCVTEFQPGYHTSPERCHDITHHDDLAHFGVGADIFPPDILHIEPENEDMTKLDVVKKEAPSPLPPVKRKRGRPRKQKVPKPKKDQPILYKFILKHLNDTTGGSRKYLEWVNKSEGLFRFYSSKKDDFAEMWGRFKGKREQMSYQNMARALRNYTRGVGNRKIMTSVRKKLHYKFTPDFIR